MRPKIATLAILMSLVLCGCNTAVDAAKTVTMDGIVPLTYKVLEVAPIDSWVVQANAQGINPTLKAKVSGLVGTIFEGEMEIALEGTALNLGVSTQGSD